MRLARKLMLLAVMALAALALSSASAFAEEPVEVTDEPGDNHCFAAKVLCETTIHGEEPTVIRAHLLSGPEIVSSSCATEFHVVVETEDGDGYIDRQHVVGPPATCPNKPCEATSQDSEDGDPWPLHMHETEGEDPIHEFGIDLEFCLEPIGGGAQRHCIIEVGFSETEMIHNYEFEAEGDGNGVPCGPGSTPPPAGVRVLVVDGHWLMEGEDIEVEQLF